MFLSAFLKCTNLFCLGSDTAFKILVKTLVISFRFIHGRKNIIEIYPGDDSVLKSEGALLGNYFIHYSIQKGTKKV